MHFYFPDRGAVHGRERHPHPAQPADPARRAGPRPARVVRTTSPRRSTRSATAPTSSSPRTTGRPGAASGSSSSSRLQRDLYAYLHDQTLRLLNQGHTGAEIAEVFELPPALDNAWHTHGYYGSVSHNVKAIYQRYMGWFDGNPARLWQHPPADRPRATSTLMGGVDAVVELAQTAFDDGDFRWAATLLDHVVFADPNHAAARGAVRRHARTARLRRRERHLAQLLPLRRHRTARRQLRHPDRNGVADDRRLS